MFKSINELNKYLKCLDELAQSESVLNNPCAINYLTAITVESILSQIDPWMVVNDCTTLCTVVPLIEQSVNGVKNELFTRYGIGLYNP